MANSAVVGTLRAVLSADTADFAVAMKKAGDAAEQAAMDMSKASASFEQAGGRMSAVTRLIKDFSGSLERRSAEEFALAIEKIGGAARLSEGELRRAQGVFADYLSKAKAMGTEVPQHIQKVSNEINKMHPAGVKAGEGLGIFHGQWLKLTAAFGAANLVDRAIRGIINFGTEAVQSASHIVDLANKTGLSTDAIQKFEHVAKQTGTTVDAFASATFKLGVNIAGATSKDNVGKALEQMGIQIAEIKRLKPEEQFDLIASKLSEMEEPQERNRLAVALFGRTVADTLPAIVENYKELARGANIASESSIKALDAAGDAWDKFLNDTKNKTIEFLGTTVLALKSQTGLAAIVEAMLAGGGALPQVMASQAAIEAQRQRDAAQRKDIHLVKDSTEANKENTVSIKQNTVAISESERKYRAWADTVTGTSVQREVDELTESVLRLMQEGKFTTGVLENVWKQVVTLEQHGGRLTPVLQLIRSEFVAFNSTGKSFFETFGNAAKVVEKFTVDFVDFTDKGESFFDTFGKGSGKVETFTVDMEEAEEATRAFRETAAAGIMQVGNAFTQLGFAIGGRGGDMVATIGGIAQGVARLGSGDILGGITQLVSLMSQFRTLGRNIARDMQDAFATSELGFENLNVLMARLRELGAGDLANRGDRAQRKDDEKATRAWMEDVRKFLADVDKKAATLFGKLANAVQDFGGKAPAALQPLIQQLLKLNSLTEEQRQLLMSLAGDPSWEDLQAIAEKYGIELSALGQKFQEARIGDIAMQYARDFMTLRDAGGDVNGLLIGMQDEVQALILDALKFGTALPEAFRPVIQGLIDMGLLTDENGNKLEDLSRFTFTGTLEDAFKEMKTVLEEIRDLLAKGLPRAADEGATEIEKRFKRMPGVRIPVTFDTGEFAPPPGFAVPQAATGGRMTRDGLIYAHAGELIVPDDGGMLPQRIDNRLYIDGREITVSVIQHLREEARRLGTRPI